ncbi:AbrB/MazE/SpoVT family DNA-binding domain-containing protein [Ignicoccus hospitalis]|uniref:AbrB/MazE/SpoVT family DNA-binding domain-containing protein n=1 Tax=Ignicoccus hospitalis TaxID=160233 RepID=UPI0011D15182|nr:AbrB/MazE/SpoVT family DNA-binding domain-containing protein [Ignicoccus hospitalis]HIH91022.1 hypothetical protein [Desulfurococcaceae archaeon]
MIERRRLVRLGRSTLVVSLPADWIKKKGLKAGDVLTLVIEDNYIKIVPDTSVSSEKVTVTIEVKGRVEGLYRAIIAAYIAGTDIIRITFENNSLLYQIMKHVKTAMNQLIGLEIVEQRPNEMVLQTFISGSEQNPTELTKRLVGLISLMIGQLLEGDQLEYLQELENEVDKLYRLALRTLNSSSEPDIFVTNLLTSLEMTSDSLVPLAQSLGDGRKEVIDVLNIAKEVVDFLHSIESAGERLSEVDEKIEVLEMVEDEIEKRELDEKLKYRLMLFVHNLKNVLLMLHNMEVRDVVKKSKERKLVI